MSSDPKPNSFLYIWRLPEKKIIRYLKNAPPEDSTIFPPPDNTKKQRKKNNEVYLYLEKTKKKNETKRSNARVTKKV